MQIKEIIKLIKTDERFKRIFHFDTDSKNKFNYMLPSSELKKAVFFC